MNSLILLSLLALPPQAPPLDVPAQAPPIECVSFEQPADAFPLTIYGMDGCDPCEEWAKESVTFTDCRFRYDKDWEHHPAWVKRIASEQGYPITAWEQDGRFVYFEGYVSSEGQRKQIDWLKEYVANPSTTQTHGCVKGCPCPQGGVCICPPGTCPHCRETETVSIPPARRQWSGPVGTRDQAIDHLLYSSHHRGHFSRSYLQSLSLSDLQRLHSHDHEGTAHRFQRSLPRTSHHSSPRVTYRSTPSYSQPRYSSPPQTYSRPVYSAPSRSYCPTCPR